MKTAVLFAVAGLAAACAAQAQEVPHGCAFRPASRVTSVKWVPPSLCSSVFESSEKFVM